MLEGPRTPLDPDDESRGILSDEELRELLSPLASMQGNGRDPVLLLTERAEDAAVISAFLTRADIPLVFAANRFVALDHFRKRRYQAFVSTSRSWDPDAEEYLRRLHEVDATIRLCFVGDPGEASPIASAPFVERPLDANALGQLWSFLEHPVAPEFPPAHDEPAAEALVGAPKGQEGTSQPAQADPLLGVRLLLEAQLAGEGLESALGRWARLDPALVGVVVLDRANSDSEWIVRVRAREADQEQDLLRDAAELLEVVRSRPPSPASHDGFSIFVDPHRASRWIALRCRRGAPDVVERLAPLLPLLEQVERR